MFRFFKCCHFSCFWRTVKKHGCFTNLSLLVVSFGWLIKLFRIRYTILVQYGYNTVYTS